ncbi:hypothetical protein FRC12_002892 [Ceratobasidium sp. 428]|nr:hypothetical protein FRC12_002892 [Ceratobasidium sp. 428]
MSHRLPRLQQSPSLPNFNALSIASPPPNPHNSFMSDHALQPNSPFACWALQNHQKGHVRALEPSPSGRWLLSAADDATVVFFDFHGGWAVARLTLDNTNGRFEVLAVVWCTEVIILCGGSNGFIYLMEFEPQNDVPITLRVILSPMVEQVSCLKLDASQTHLAIAYGTSVAIYSRASDAGFDSWEFVDRVAKPSGDPHYLVHGICWFGQGSCKLLVGYAAAGMGIWESPQRVHFLENTLNNMCTIGNFSLSGDESFLATTTLEQTVVTFPMSVYGPVLEEANVYEYPKTISKMLVLPVAISSTNFVLCGTAVSDVIVIYPSGVPAYAIKGGLDYIQAIASFGNLIVVASSGPGEYQLKCYMSQVQRDGAASWVRGSAPEIKHVTCAQALIAGRIAHALPKGTITEVSEHEDIQTTTCDVPSPAKTKSTLLLKPAAPKPKLEDQNYVANTFAFVKIVIAKLFKVGQAWLRLDRHSLVTCFAIWLAFTTVILAITPPGAKSFSQTWKPSSDKQLYKAGFEPDEMLLIWAVRTAYRFTTHQVRAWCKFYADVVHACTLGLPRTLMRLAGGWLRNLYNELYRN